MEIRDWLTAGVEMREVCEDIYTVLPQEQCAHHYDRLSRGYDLLIGNSLYNRLVWGNWAADYMAFTRQALDSATGPYLDAGCGTLVFTAKPYLESQRPVVLLDRSLGMLRRARRRLLSLHGSVPDHILLLQGDIFHLPFRDGIFNTVASYGVLHLFSDIEAVAGETRRVAAARAGIYLSSLIREQGIGRYYYDLLVSSGEIAERRRAIDVQRKLETVLNPLQTRVQGNMIYVEHKD